MAEPEPRPCAKCGAAMRHRVGKGWDCRRCYQRRHPEKKRTRSEEERRAQSARDREAKRAWRERMEEQRRRGMAREKREREQQARARKRAQLRQREVWRAGAAERRRARRRAWRLSNPEKARQKDRESRERRRARNPEIFRERKRRHRARKRGQRIGAVTGEEVRQRWELWGGRCWICGRAAAEMDHVKPLAAGGAHAACNLRPICKSCNSRKGARWPLETGGQPKGG